MTPPEPALQASDAIRLDGDVPVLHLPEDLDVEALKAWLTERVGAAGLSDRTVRLHLGDRAFVLLDVRRLVSFLKTSFQLEATAVYVRPGEAHRFAERQARLRFIVVPMEVESPTEEVVEASVVADTVNTEADDTTEATASVGTGDLEATETPVDEDGTVVAGGLEDDAQSAVEGRPETGEVDEEEALRPSMPALPDEDPRARRTLHITRTLRSGVSLRFDGDVVLVGDVNPGAEIVCSGNVHVWGACKGLVHAGALGDETCRVMALDLRPTQIRIGRRIALLEVRDNAGVPEVARVDVGRIRIEPFRARVR